RGRCSRTASGHSRSSCWRARRRWSSWRRSSPARVSPRPERSCARCRPVSSRTARSRRRSRRSPRRSAAARSQRRWRPRSGSSREASALDRPRAQPAGTPLPRQRHRLRSARRGRAGGGDGRQPRQGRRRRRGRFRAVDGLQLVALARAAAGERAAGAVTVARSREELVEALCGDLARIRAPRGGKLNARSWQTEAPLRMLLNNLDPEVAEKPEQLVVYGGTGRAARDHGSLKALVRSLLVLGEDETLLVQSGKPVGVFRTHPAAPRVLIANALLVPRWATWNEFRRLEALGLTMFGQMTAGSWIYIGTQGILQGTYQTFAAAAATHFGTADLRGRTILTAGLGGMGGAQPLAATLLGAAILCVEVDPRRIARRLETRYLDEQADSLDGAVARVAAAAA